jgi:hypothetical protein
VRQIGGKNAAMSGILTHRKPIGKVRRTLPIDIHDTSITPIDENDRKQSYNKGAGTDRSGLVRKARSID